VIDGTGRAPQLGPSVLIEGDRIVAIRDKPSALPKIRPVIEGGGNVLSPRPLIDTHHLDGGRVGNSSTAPAWKRPLGHVHRHRPADAFTPSSITKKTCVRPSRIWPR